MELPFYFDYACPWAYLGSCRVESCFSDLGAEIDFRPVSLAMLYEPPPDGSGRPRLGERKKRNYANDMRHWAEMIGAEVAQHQPKQRPSSNLLLRAALVAKDQGRFRQFHYPAYRARWAEAKDISQRSVVRELLEGAGLEGDECLETAESEALQERLVNDTSAAMDRGVFGVPTLFVGDEMFWGNDRYELVRYYLEKQRS